jgi:hypothetical protein
MTNCKPKNTPSEQKLEGNTETYENQREYRMAIGSLIYAMTCTRPDISWVVTKLSQYLSNPLKYHWVGVKHVFRYIKGTLDYKLCFRKSDEINLYGYSDADWAVSMEDRRSVTGYCFSLTKSGPLISWKSRKQPTVALSTCEAEYMALAACVQECLFLLQLLNDFMCTQTMPITIYEDNQGTIELSKNPIQHQRSKHIDVRFHFIRDEIMKNKVKIEYCPTMEMLADLLTKPITKAKLEKFHDVIFGFNGRVGN